MLKRNRPMNQKKLTLVAFIMVGMIASSVFGQTRTDKSRTEPTPRGEKPFVTFVELGSVKCIPCRKMQPVMKAIEQKYGDQVKVVFHDVWKEEGRPYAQKYGIRLIPTQVFLDAKGKEFFRHEGFYPEEQIHKLLQQRGLQVVGVGG